MFSGFEGVSPKPYAPKPQPCDTAAAIWHPSNRHACCNTKMELLYRQAAALILAVPVCMRGVLCSCAHLTQSKVLAIEGGQGLVQSVGGDAFRLSSHTCDATMASLILPIAVEAPVPTTTALQRPDVTWVPCMQHPHMWQHKQQQLRLSGSPWHNPASRLQGPHTLPSVTPNRTQQLAT